MGIKLIKVEDLKEGSGRIVVTEDGEEIALFKVKGEIYALANACPHEGGPLGEGKVKAATVVCPWHDWEFDLKSGACINVPYAQAKTYKTEIIDGFIYLLGQDKGEFCC